MIWTDELKNREPTTITVRLQKEVDKYKVVSLFCGTMLPYKKNFVQKFTGFFLDYSSLTKIRER